MSHHQLFPTEPERLPSNVREIFEEMCEALPREEAWALAPAVRDHARAVRSAQKANEFLDADTAEQIASALIAILMDYDSFKDDHKRLIIGAIRYFVTSQDAEADLTSILGFEDDALVLNYVLEIIGREDLKVAV